jgi:septum formation protein
MMTGNRIILASRSPRRYELLQKIVPVENILVMASDITESILPGENGIQFTKRVAFAKVNCVLNNLIEHSSADIILGADTIIALDHELIGKPYDDKSAYRILEKLRNRWHTVITGVCLVIIGSNDKRIFAVSSDVLMRDYSDAEIKDYIKTGEPLDKAGAYAIQSKGKDLVQEYKGSYTNIVGLPIEEISVQLRGMDCGKMLS